ncbi:MAG: DUF805 domain-containing protein [Bdellovibrionales bacterium]|nr:DUF805 domain-containing protein [Bdellovibrionales bacterium]
MRKAPSRDLPPVPALEIVRGVLRDRYADFSGRASRREYWVFVGFYLLGMAFLKSFSRGIPALAFAQMVFFLAFLVPLFALAVRRLHDIDRPGWWMLVAAVPVLGTFAFLFMLCAEGSRGRNRFGPDPLRPERVGPPKPYYGDGFDDMNDDPANESGSGGGPIRPR